MDDRVLLIRTGGTIDAECYANPKRPPEYVSTRKGSDSLIMPTVRDKLHYTNVDEYSWGCWKEDCFVKDSQQFTKDNIRELAYLIKNDSHRHIVITHGTDAMVKNALMLQQELKHSGKVVDFVGAMVPLSMHEKHTSDGIAALDFALSNIHSQSPGVHIVGRDTQTRRITFFEPQEVQKDRDASLAGLNFVLRPR